MPFFLSGKESTWQCRRCRFDPWVWKTPEEGNGNSLQFSCLENPMDRGAWRVTVTIRNSGLQVGASKLSLQTVRGTGGFRESISR